MTDHLRRWLPEYVLGIVGLFFFCRELGIFPGSWIDEGLFIMVARSVAAGHGYAIQLLEYNWQYPYFLAIGPTVVLPVAVSLKLFGISVAAARLPMVGYLIAISISVWFFTRKTQGLREARWATALLITLSAFVNTGKPVLGEVPAFFFLLLGLYALETIKQPWKRGAVAGVLFGLSFLTKLTFGLILPALGIAWFVALFRRKWDEFSALTLAGVVILVVYAPWRILESIHTPLGSFSQEISKFVLGGGDTPLMYVLRENREILLRLPFVAYAVILVLGCIGLWSLRGRMRESTLIVTASLILLFTLYFLNSYGWYRHLLPAHLLLIAFVPLGTERLLGRKMAAIVLTAIILLQGIWQLDHRGSGLGTGAVETVQILQEQYIQEPLFIEESEIFAQLPENPLWLFLIRDGVSPTMPIEFRTPSAATRCRRHLRKLNAAEELLYGDRAARVGNYFIIPPPADCPATSAR